MILIIQLLELLEIFSPHIEKSKAFLAKKLGDFSCFFRNFNTFIITSYDTDYSVFFYQGTIRILQEKLNKYLKNAKNEVKKYHLY